MVCIAESSPRKAPLASSKSFTQHRTCWNSRRVPGEQKRGGTEVFPSQKRAHVSQRMHRRSLALLPSSAGFPAHTGVLLSLFPDSSLHQPSSNPIYPRSTFPPLSASFQLNPPADALLHRAPPAPCCSARRSILNKQQVFVFPSIVNTA